MAGAKDESDEGSQRDLTKSYDTHYLEASPVSCPTLLSRPSNCSFGGSTLQLVCMRASLARDSTKLASKLHRIPC